MESSVLERGWVSIQSGLLCLRQKRWLVLATDGLYTFKSDEATECLSRISIGLVTGVEKKVSGCKKNSSSFKVSTAQKTTVFFVEDPQLVQRWVKELSNLIASIQQRKNERIHYGREIIIKSFLTLKELLDGREEELLRANQQLFEECQTKAKHALRQAHDEHSALRIPANSPSSSSTQLQKLQQLNEYMQILKQAEPAFPKLDLALHANIRTNWLSLFISNFVQLHFVNLNEFEVRRSPTTRALKWRYSGEKADALTFQVSQTVRLTAISLCRPYKTPGQTFINKFLILSGHATDGKPVYVHSKRPLVPFDAKDSVYKVQLSKPLALSKGQFYTVLLVLDGEATYKCVDCESVVIAGQTKWQFYSTVFTRGYLSNHSDATCGPIAGFQFQT